MGNGMQRMCNCSICGAIRVSYYVFSLFQTQRVATHVPRDARRLRRRHPHRHLWQSARSRRGVGSQKDAYGPQFLHRGSRLLRPLPLLVVSEHFHIIYRHTYSFESLNVSPHVEARWTFYLLTMSRVTLQLKYPC